MEERILLSADPVGALAQTVVWSAPALDDEGFATHPSGSASTGDVSLRQGQIPLSTAMDDAFFSVDGLAFDQALTQTRSAFMESALALSDADYARFMDGVLSTPAGPSLGLGGVSVDLALTISDIDLVLGRAGKDVAFGADAPGQAQDMTLAEGRYDVTDLAQGMRSVDVSALLVQPGASLGGSGAMSAQVINQGTLAPGYSPGVLDLTNGLVSGSDSVLQIELGGNTPGTGSGFHDQVIVSGGGVSLDGQLQVSLWDGFVPQDGDVFTFLTFESITGGFRGASGLVDVGNGLYYTLEQSANALSLVAHRVDAATAQLLSMLGADALNGSAGANALGMALNADYFSQNTSFGFSGSLSLGQGLTLAGDFSLQRSAGVSLGGQSVDVWKVGLGNGSGYLGVDAADVAKPGLALSGVNVALLLADDTTSDLAWIWAQGSASGVTLRGLPGGSLTATDLSIDFGLGIGSVGGVSNDTLLDLSAAPVAVSVGSTTVSFGSKAAGERSTVAGLVTLTLPGELTLSGTVGAAVSDTGLLAAGRDMTALLQAGGLQLGLEQGAFGLVLLADASGYLLEASGSVVIRGGDFATVSATAAFLSLNTTGVAQTARTLQFG
ncbi:MAG: LEPR-XLL domain-containing protein, partial [Hydrogenophaga sp.]|nr:LEPR-XLL domain-containing protein [Hydrogenophaga sp.]